MSVIKKLYLEEDLYPVENYDFGDVDDDSNRNNFDFYDIDDDPPVTGDDEGLYNFGYLDIPGSETAEGDYDMETDIDPGEQGEELDYDFWDIDEHDPMYPTQFDIEYDFGDSSELGFQKTKEWLIKALRDSVEEMKHDKSYVVSEVEMEQGVDPYVVFQYFYNERTNKSFIQFNMYNHNRGSEWNKDELVERITRKIYSQFKYDTGIWPEIMNRDQKKRVPDNRRTITPYTIGYWYSLDNTYETIEDKAEITLDSRSFKMPPPPMDDDGHILPPEKKIEDFFDIAEQIARDYNLLNEISRENRNDYITEYYNILKETHGKGNYLDRVAELDALYNPNKYNNANIPNAMIEYMEKYEGFFNYRLPLIHSYTRRCNVKIEKVA